MCEYLTIFVKRTPFGNKTTLNPISNSSLGIGNYLFVLRIAQNVFLKITIVLPKEFTVILLCTWAKRLEIVFESKQS